MQGSDYAQYDFTQFFLDCAISAMLQCLACIETLSATLTENPVFRLPPIGSESLLPVPVLKYVYAVVPAFGVRTVGKRDAQLEKVARRGANRVIALERKRLPAISACEFSILCSYSIAIIRNRFAAARRRTFIAHAKVRAGRIAAHCPTDFNPEFRKEYRSERIPFARALILVQYPSWSDYRDSTAHSPIDGGNTNRV